MARMNAGKPTAAPSRGRRWGAALGLAVCVVVFPLVVITAGIHHLLGIERAQVLRARFARLQRRLSVVRPLADELAWLERVLTRTMQGAGRAPEPVGAAIARCRRLIARHPRLFDCIVFDRGGEVAWQSHPEGGGPGIPRRLLRLIRESREEQPAGDRPTQTVMNRWLGSQLKPLEQIVQGRRLVVTSPRERRSWFFHHLDARFAVFIRLHRTGWPTMLPLRLLTGATAARPVRFLLVDLRDRKVYGRVPIGRAAFDRLLGRFEQDPATEFVGDGQLWSLAILDPRFRLVATTADRGIDRPAAAARWLAAFTVVAGLTAWGWLARLLGREPPPYLSIRTKLAGVFLLANGLPLLVLGLAVHAALLSHREDLRLQTWRDLSLRIRTFDHRFPVALRDAEYQITGLLRRWSRLPALDAAVIRTDLERFREEYCCSTFKVLDESGHGWRVSDRPNVETTDPLLQGVMQAMLDRINGRDPDRSRPLVNRAELLAATVYGRDLATLVDDLLAHLGRLYRLEVSQSPTWLFADAMVDPDGAARSLLAVTWEDAALVRFYLRRWLPFHGADQHGTRLLAIDQGVKWLATDVAGQGRRQRRYFRFMPPLPRTRATLGFLRSLTHARQELHGTVRWQGAPHLYCCLPGALLRDRLLVALRPEAPITAEVAGWRRRIVSLALVSVIFTYVLGRYLAGRILGPVRELAAGVAAIQAQRFTHRIPLGDRDELGDLAVTFNAMMNSLHEVQLAREVQARLLPAAPVRCGPFVAAGGSRPAAELGGDLFDLRLVGEDRLVVLIGDVAGHGVPAALGMAMCKALFDTHVARAAEPEVLLAAINETLHRVMGRCPVTACLAVADRRTDQVVVVACGHPRPLRWRPGGRAAEVATPAALPLGSSRRTRARAVGVALAPGERLLLYTDGAVEGLHRFTADGRLLVDGGPCFTACVEALPDRPPAELCAHLLANHPAVTAGGPLIDDLTVVILARDP